MKTRISHPPNVIERAAAIRRAYGFGHQVIALMLTSEYEATYTRDMVRRMLEGYDKRTNKQ